MDTRAYILNRMDECRPEMPWMPDTRARMAAWQRRARARIRAIAGVPASESAAARAVVEDRRAFRGWTRETVRFESRAGCEVFGYLVRPQGAPEPLPTVLCLPGHGRGVDSIVGIASDGTQRPLGAPGEYQADFALQCVAAGYAAFAIEQIGFGHSRDERARREGPDATSCVRDSPAALMLGESVTGWRVADASRAIDYLLTRPDVDPRRILSMGISGGGLTPLWTAALDTRIHTAVVSGYFNTFRDSILSVDHCVDNYVPGMLKLMEMPDMAGLVAPRGLFVESGTDDPLFPVRAFRRAVERASTVYEAFGAPEAFAHEEFPGDHHFHGVGAFRFLKLRCPH